MFGSLSSEARAIRSRSYLEPVNLPGGAHLMREGEAGDSLFFVAVGRLRVTMTREDGTQALLRGARTRRSRRRARGDDQRAAFGRRDRATATARCSSSRVRRSRNSSPSSPTRCAEITTQVVRRLVRSFREGSPTSPVVTIAVVPLSADRRRPSSRLGWATRSTGSPAPPATSPPPRRPPRWATSDASVPTDWHRGSRKRELGFEAVVYSAEPEPNDWTAACVRQADLVLLVGAAGEEPSVRGRPRDRSSAPLGARPAPNWCSCTRRTHAIPAAPAGGCSTAPSIATTTCTSIATATSTASHVSCSAGASAWCSVAVALAVSPASVCSRH